MTAIWADAAYTGRFRSGGGAPLGAAEVALRVKEKPRRIQVLPRRWMVERSFAWLGQARRLAKDYERLPETVVATIHVAMNRIMLRRLVRAAC